MDAVEKFKNYLETEMKNIKESLCNYRKKCIAENWDIENMTKDALEYYYLDDILKASKASSIFGNFSDLSVMLLDSKLKGLDCFQVILYFIERNIKNGILEDKAIESKKCYTMTDITYDMASQIIFDKWYGLSTFRDERLEQTKLVSSSGPPLEMKILIHTHKQLKEYYLDKKQSYTESDIKKIIEILHELGIDRCLCSNIEISLKKEVEKREKQSILENDKKQSNKTVVYKIQSTNMDTITDKEYKTIRKQIAEYYNEYMGEILKPITDERMIQISSLMIQANYDREKNQSILQRCNKK